MTPDDLVVEVRDSGLQRIGIIPTDDLSIVATARHRAVGSYSITVPTGSLYASQLREPGSGVIISLHGKEFLSGPISTPEIKYTTDDAAGTITFTGVSDTIILSDRLAYPQPSNEDVATQNVASWSYTGSAESAMHQLVKVNAGVSASVSRIIAGLLNGHDDSQGVVATYTARWGTLASYLNVWGGANELGYQIIQRGDNLVFETWTLNDMTQEIRLSVEGGGLTSAKISYSPPGLTHAIVGGSGSGAARLIREYTTTKSQQGSLAWDRRIERFIDQSGAQNTTDMQTAGLKELNAKGFTVVSAQAIPTSGIDSQMVFGQDWQVGDYVTLEFEGKELDTSVSEAVLSAGPGGMKLGVVLGDATGFSPTARVAGKLEEQTRAYERTTVENEIPTQDIAQAQADIAVAQSDISAAQTEIVSHSSALTTHSATLSTHTAAITTAQADITTAQADIATNTADIATNTADIAALQAEVVDLQTDGDAPASSPTPTTVGGLQQIFVRWNASANPDPVTFEVHVSTSNASPAVAGDVATLLEETGATFISTRVDAAGMPLKFNTDGSNTNDPALRQTYYFAVIEKDADGAAAPSDWVEGRIDLAAQGDIVAGSVTTELLASVFAILGEMQIGSVAGSGAGITAKPPVNTGGEISGGIEVTNSSGEVIVRLHPDGCFVRGRLEADQLTVLEELQILVSAELSQGATLELKGKVKDPTTAPTLTQGAITQQAFVSTMPAGYAAYGLTWDATTSHWYQLIFSGSTSNAYLRKISTTGTLVSTTLLGKSSYDVSSCIRGLTVVGSSVYWAGMLASDDVQYALFKNSISTGAYQASTLGDDIGLHVFGDGTNVYVHEDWTSSFGSGATGVTKHSSTPAETGTARMPTYTTGYYTGGASISDLGYGSSKLMFMRWSGSTVKEWVVNVPSTWTGETVTEVSNTTRSQMPVSNEYTVHPSLGLCSHAVGGSTLSRWSNYLVSSDATWAAKYADTKVSGTPDYTTAISPTSTNLTVLSRNFVTVTLPPLASGAEGSDVWVGYGNGSTPSTFYKRSETLSGRALVLTSLKDTSGGTTTPDSGKTLFPSGTPAEIYSESGGFKVKGDGTVEIGGYRIDDDWTTFTPTWNGTLGNGTLVGHYKRIGKTVHYWLQLVWGSTTSSSGSWTFALPFAIDAAVTHRLSVGEGTFFDTSASAVYRVTGMRSSSTVLQPVIDGTTAGGPMRSLSGTSPVTAATGDALIVSGTYETDAA